MATSDSSGAHDRQPPAAAAWLGIVAVLFGILLTAHHANEWLVQKVISPDSAAARGIEPECPEDELEEEGVSAAECLLMVSQVKIMIASRPVWFRAFQMTVTAAGAVIAFMSVFVGIGLVDNRSWAPRAAVFVFAALLVIDVAQLTAAVNTGPLLRAAYLWNILLWFFVHLCMTVAALTGRSSERSA